MSDIIYADDLRMLREKAVKLRKIFEDKKIADPAIDEENSSEAKAFMEAQYSFFEAATLFADRKYDTQEEIVFEITRLASYLSWGIYIPVKNGEPAPGVIMGCDGFVRAARNIMPECGLRWVQSIPAGH